MYQVSPSCDIYIPNHPVPVLDKFGGSLTIEKYRKNNYFQEKEYRVLIPPMVAIVSNIEERHRSKHKNSLSMTSTDHFTFAQANS